MVTNVKDVIAPCPVCGRRLKIRSEYLGQHIKCRHCHGQFVATQGRGVEGERKPDGGSANSRTVLLVEQRDEVYARLAADLAEAGFNVVRATTALEAMKYYARSKQALVVANLNLPDQSGWLLAGKLHFIQDGVRIWLYEPRKTATDVSMAKFLRVDELLAYGGDLFGLSDTILDCVAGTPRRTPSPQRLSVSSRHGAAGTAV